MSSSTATSPTGTSSNRRSAFDNKAGIRLMPYPRFCPLEKTMSFPTEGMQDGQDSIACAKVALSVLRGVIFEAHVPENDGISFCSVLCGGRNSVKLLIMIVFRNAEAGIRLMPYPRFCPSEKPALSLWRAPKERKYVMLSPKGAKHLFPPEQMPGKDPSLALRMTDSGAAATSAAAPLLSFPSERRRRFGQTKGRRVMPAAAASPL